MILSVMFSTLTTSLPLPLCSEDKPWCEWELEQGLVSSSFTAPAPRCPSILTSDSGGRKNLFGFRKGFVEWASNQTGFAKDISYERLWTEEPTFTVWANLSTKQSGSGSGGGGGTSVESPISKMFVNMMPDSFKAFSDASSASRFQKEFTPQQGCRDRKLEPLSHPVIGMPWCGHWNASAVIGKISCGIVESGQSHVHTAWSIYSAHGIISAKDTFNHQSAIKMLRSKLDPAVGVEFYDQLGAIGYVEYINTPGHFPNEVLPRLLFLDKFLPPDVPILWPHSNNGIARSFENLMRKYGLLSSRRLVRMPFTTQDKHGHPIPSTIVVSNLYFVTTATRAGEPLCLWALHRLLATSWHSRVVPSLIKAKGESASRAKVFVLKRGNGRGARSITNHEELMASLRAALDKPSNETLGFKSPPEIRRNTTSQGGSLVEQFEVEKGGGLSLEEIATHLAQARVFIAPHGAGLNNMILLPPASTIIEIGYRSPPGGFVWPPDYLCLARNLGFDYYATLATEGDHESPLKVNVQEIVSIVKLSLLKKS